MKFKISEYESFAKAIAQDKGISSSKRKLWANRISDLLTQMKSNTFGDPNKIGFHTYVLEDFKSVLQQAGIESGAICELGGPQKSFANLMPEFDFNFLALEPPNKKDQKAYNIMIGDITQCDHIPSGVFDAVFSKSVFEHISKPWKAAEHVKRILKPGGICYHAAPFSYFYHGSPFDFWRYTPDAFKLLYSDLKPLKAELYGKNRRRDNRGSLKYPVDKDGGPAFAVDGFGGWRENWFTIYAGQKDSTYIQQKLITAKKQVVTNLLHEAIRLGSGERRWHNAALKVQVILKSYSINHDAELTRVPENKGTDISLNEIRDIWQNRNTVGPDIDYSRYVMANKVGLK